MANLHKSTRQADTAREACTCVLECTAGCPHRGRWHTHDQDPCAVHPQLLVEGASG